MRHPYPTDLTDAEWEIARAYIPETVHVPNLMIPKYARRDVVNGILYRERTGCQWRNLPHDFPPWKQVFEYFRKWRNDGTIERLHDGLRAKVREQTPRADGTVRSDDPTICILDSQSAKTSEEAAPETRGYDAGKKVKGRKRHLVVDALGLLLVGWGDSRFSSGSRCSGVDPRGGETQLHFARKGVPGWRLPRGGQAGD